MIAFFVRPVLPLSVVRSRSRGLPFLGLALLAAASAFAASDRVAHVWLTTNEKSALLAPQPALAVGAAAAGEAEIVVDPAQRFQSMAGFGFALTGGSADHLVRMTAAKRARLLKELFSTEGAGIGISYLRVSIGASDLNERVFSYDDLPPGKTDVRLEKFDLSEDRRNVIPILKEILVINPAIEILGSPWSAPAWMKTNQRVQGGKLKDEYYPVYARYFVKYIEAMAREGITIHAVTLQNEPHNDGNTPSMQMFAKEQARFIAQHVGPAFKQAGLTTKIILWDHNCDAPEYPISILHEPEAAQYVDGSGFHLYAGDVRAMSKVHDAFPTKHLYFTEMMAVSKTDFNVAKPVARIVIGATRNWSRNVILWNLAADREFKPHTDNGGCSICQGAITIDGDEVERNLAYYTIGHVSKFVPAGSVRIASTEQAHVPNVAFATPTGRTVLVVANPGATPQSFRIREGDDAWQASLPAASVATYVW